MVGTHAIVDCILKGQRGVRLPTVNSNFSRTLSGHGSSSWCLTGELEMAMLAEVKPRRYKYRNRSA
jgi:hypothetical protein